MIRIVLADLHPLIREGIKKTLESERDIMVVGEAWDIASLMSALDRQQVDIVLLDLSLDPSDDLAALRMVRERFATVRVLVLTSHPESRAGVASLREGASGYLIKTMTVDVIARAIRKVHSGGHYVSECMADLLARDLTTPLEFRPHELLTAREAQVMVLLASGLSVKQTAGELHISISSVNTYRTRIFSKMKLKTNAELIRYGITHGLTP